MYVQPEVYDYIKSLREGHPRLGKEKIKILLDKYCQEENLEPVSVSKIGRIIKRNNWFFYLGKRTKRGARANKKRVFGYEVKKPGDLIQLDTVVRFEQGIKRYIFTAIDVVSRFSFAFTYKSISSKHASDFAQKLLKVIPYPISAIQTDNGSEFLKTFDQVLARGGVVHFFTYPRCPKQNGVVERFNRTIQEEFVESYRDLLCHDDPSIFNNLLVDYLLFYNLKRPHHSLGLKVPMQAVVEYLKESNMYWTDTRA
jgi:transposase InsO family protein